MKMLGQSKALRELRKIKENLRTEIRENYEHRAQDCAACPTRGICCVDAHFVNVRITKLEAVAIRETLKKLGAKKSGEVFRRAENAVENYQLANGGETFACPLFEKNVGCLVHGEAKPAPCIQHACYENQADLPPDELLVVAENEIDLLNRRTYGKNPARLPLPLWLNKISPFEQKDF